MKKLLGICLLLALLSCSKQELTTEESPQTFNKNLLFIYEGKSYSSNYFVNKDESFEWENTEVGELYESILASNSVIEFAGGDTLKILSGDEAEAIKEEFQSNFKEVEGRKSIQTRAMEITAFRLTLYAGIDFAYKMETVTREGVEKVKEDAYIYQYLTYYINNGNLSYVPKSLTFVVLRQEENSFYPKYNAKVIIRTHYTDKYGREIQENYATFSTEKYGYSIKIPDLRTAGLSNPGRVSSHTYCHVSVW